MKAACIALSLLGSLVSMIQSSPIKVVMDDVGVMHFQETNVEQLQTMGKEKEEEITTSARRLMNGNIFSNSDKMQILDAHNTDRSNTALGKLSNQPMATDMTQMIWSNDLGSTAASYASQCVWGHSSSSYGENLYVSFSNDATSENLGTILSGITSWFNEYQYYTYSSGSCMSGKSCGHYTQVVWAKSLRVGCGYAVCNPTTMMGSGYNYKYAIYLVCNYDPPGNYVGKSPYTKTTDATQIASSCTSGYYSNPGTGLCMRSDGSNGIDSSPGITTTQGATTTTKVGSTTTTAVGTTTTKVATTAVTGSCSTCSVRWRVSYVTSSWSSVSQIVWNNAVSVVKAQTKKGYGISGSYSTTYFDISATTYSYSDATNLQSYVSGTTYVSQLSSQLGSSVSSGTLVITTQPITSSSGAQAYNGEEGSSDTDSDSSGGSEDTTWIWVVAIIIGLAVGFACGFGIFVYRKNKQKEQDQSYVKMVDFVTQ